MCLKLLASAINGSYARSGENSPSHNEEKPTKCGLQNLNNIGIAVFSIIFAVFQSRKNCIIKKTIHKNRQGYGMSVICERRERRKRCCTEKCGNAKGGWGNFWR